MKQHRMTVSLTAHEARLVWGLLDGVIDAGACEDGLSEQERDAAWKVLTALGKIMHKEPRHD